MVFFITASVWFIVGLAGALLVHEIINSSKEG